MLPSTLFIGRNVIFLESIPSTNRYAADRVRSGGLPEGTVIIAGEQTEGRGQRGNQWQSVPGLNLTFTLVLSPGFLPLSASFMLNKLTSLAVKQMAEELTAAHAQVKWPNDVLLNELKTAGILIENVIGSGGIQWTLAGIGINVNQTNFPGLPYATSLSRETGNRYDLQSVLARFCELFEGLYLQLRGGSERINRAYLSCLAGYGEWRKYIMEEREVTARITNIDSEGRLCIENISGEKFCCEMKEIAYAYS